MEKINIAELLKDCPKGMELDCLLFDNAILTKVANFDLNYPICIDSKCGHSTWLTKYGQYVDIESAKCVIFPKGKNTWEGFIPPCPFKDGDVLHIVTGEGDYSLCIVDCIIGNVLYTKASCSYNGHFLCTCEEQVNMDELVVARLATDEGKQILFDAINKDGYKWNAETKTLEKLAEPKFKLGDNIRIKGESTTHIVTEVRENLYILDIKDISLSFENQDQWELVPNKFDISTLVPFESRVLVRDSDIGIWLPEFFGCLCDGNDCPYMIVGGTRWKCCIPYEGNEHLLNKTDDCIDFYKTWE